MNQWDEEPDPGEVEGLVDKIRPFLAGKHPAVQSATLVELTAMWLAGNVCLDDEAETQKMRDEFLAMFVETVKLMVPVYYEHLIKPRLEGGDDARDPRRSRQSH